MGEYSDFERSSLAAKGTAPVAKFSDYIFKEGATHGKDAVFTGLRPLK